MGPKPRYIPKERPGGASCNNNIRGSHIITGKLRLLQGGGVILDPPPLKATPKLRGPKAALPCRGPPAARRALRAPKTKAFKKTYLKAPKRPFGPLKPLKGPFGARKPPTAAKAAYGGPAFGRPKVLGVLKSKDDWPTGRSAF